MDQLASDQTLPRNLSPNKGASSLKAVFFFFLFPPVGIYLLWRDKELHELFAILTALLGFFHTLTFGSLYFSFDLFAEFSQQIGYNPPNYLDKYLLILLFFAIYQTLSCLVLVREAKKTGYLTTLRLLYLLGMLLLDYLVIPLILGSVIFDFLKAYIAKYQEQFEGVSVDSY